MSDSKQLSIADHIANSTNQQSRSSKRLQDIAGAIDWKPLYRLARKVDKTDPETGGRPRTPARWMVRALFLKHSYGLSDPELEDQLIDRLSFRKFVGLPLDQPVPDFTTFWNFQEDLIAQGLIDDMFTEINRQLEQQGLMIKQGTIVDAAIVESSNRPLSDDKREEQNENPSSQVDTDARSTKKGGDWHFGYKGHIGMDATSKLIRKAVWTPANTHDSQVLPDLLTNNERGVFADKAYSNTSVKRLAREDGWYYGILDKAKKNQPLSRSQKKRNKTLQRIRCQVEHAFAAMKQQYGLAVAKAKTKLRNRARFLMGCMCWNIERSLRLHPEGNLESAAAAVPRG